jgi:hypothetical protein
MSAVHPRSRSPQGNGGLHRKAGRAHRRWAMRHLAKDLKANLVIMGDFNEGHPVGNLG